MRIPVDWHSAAACLQLVRTMLFLSLTISSAQNIFNSPAFGPDGLLAWRFLKYAYQEKRLEVDVLDLPFGRTGWIILNLLRIGLLVAGFAGIALSLVLIGLLVISVVIYIRGFLLMSAADQLNTILLFCLTPCAWLPSQGLSTICLCAIAGQVIICYFSNGLRKATASGWFNGSALRALLQTGNYSRKWVARLAVRTDPSAFRLLGKVTVFWEISAILTPFLPLPLLWVFLGLGVIFHLINAVVMGLNTFLWSFVSTYPAILFCRQWLDGALQHIK